MNPNIIREMDAPTKRRFHFASSSFSRVYGVDKVTREMIDFCHRWAMLTETAPLDSLNSVDRYFKDLWNHEKL